MLESFIAFHEVWIEVSCCRFCAWFPSSYSGLDSALFRGGDLDEVCRERRGVQRRRGWEGFAFARGVGSSEACAWMSLGFL